MVSWLETFIFVPSVHGKLQNFSLEAATLNITGLHFLIKEIYFVNKILQLKCLDQKIVAI